MLTPGVRLVDRPGALHFVDGRRVVSLELDAPARATVRAALTAHDRTPAEGRDSPAPGRRHVRLLGELDRLGVLGPAGPGPAGVGASFAAAVAGGRTAVDEASHRLAGTTVHVLHGDPAVPGAPALLDELAGCGLRCASIPDTGRIVTLDPAHDLVVAVAGDTRPGSGLREVNAACLEAGVTWLPVSGYDGSVLRVGPLVVPGESACFVCTELRLAANVEYAELYLDVVADAPPAPAPRALRSWAYALVALHLLHWVANRDPRVPGRLLTLVADDLVVRPAHVYRVPRCPACSGPEYLVASAPWAVGRDH